MENQQDIEEEDPKLAELRTKLEATEGWEDDIITAKYQAQLQTEIDYLMGKHLPAKMKEMREYWGCSANFLSTVCGFGINQWRLYEGGQTPNRSNRNMIEMALNPLTFQKLLQLLDDESKAYASSLFNRVASICGMIEGEAELAKQQIAKRWISKHKDQ